MQDIKLVRDKRTQRAAKRPAGPAGTRAAHKRTPPPGDHVRRFVRASVRECAIRVLRSMPRKRRRALAQFGLTVLRACPADTRCAITPQPSRLGCIVTIRGSRENRAAFVTEAAWRHVPHSSLARSLFER